MQRQLFRAELAMPSTDIVREANFIAQGDTRITFDFFRSGEIYRGGIAFARCLAFRHIAERFCSTWEINAYDAILEIENSAWLEAVRLTEKENGVEPIDLHHYLIYLDSSGAFEVLATDWSFLDAAWLRSAAP